ncbi:MAG: peptidoglycan-binding domain-containing protein [Patescibacteria group bacterium]
MNRKKLFQTGSVIATMAMTLVAAFAVAGQASPRAEAQVTTTTTTAVVVTTPAYTRDLTIGSTGADVVALQTFLVARGHLVMPPGVAMGYFGQLTRAALARYQASAGIPATGYFGPITRANLNSMGGGPVVVIPPTCPTGFTCTPNNPPVAVCPVGFVCTPTTNPNPTNDGSEGQLTEIEVSGGTDSSVEEGQEDARVLGIQFEAQDSDITLSRVDVEFDLSGAAGNESDNLDRYIDSVSLVLDGRVIDTMDIDDAEDDDEIFSFRFTGLNARINEDATGRLYVTVDAVSSVESDDETTDIVVRIPTDGIRAIDEANITETYVDSTDDLEDTFRVGERSVGDLNINIDDADNDDRTVSIDEDETTEDVTLLAFTLDSEDQTNTVTDLTVDLDATGADASDIIDTLYLFVDDEEVASESVGGTGDVSVSFDDVDFDVEEDETVDVEIRADIRELDGNYSNGASIRATIQETGIESEDEEGDDTEIGGGDAEGGLLTLRTSGTMVDNGTRNASVRTNVNTTNSDDQGVYTIDFTVEAFEDPAYVELSAFQGTAETDTGVNYLIETASNVTVTTGTTTATLEHLNGGSRTGSFVRINDGSSATFRLTVYFDPSVSGSYRAQLYSINFAETAVQPTIQEVTSPEQDYETPSVLVLD